MKDAAELITAIGQFIWPIAVIWIIWSFRVEIRRLLSQGSKFGLKVPGCEVIVEPTKVQLRPEQEHGTVLPAVDTGKPLPADYFFLNHTSFLREDMQEEFNRRCKLTGVPHYDIRVTLDSFYEGALERVKYVVYFLHKEYPEPVQAKSNRKGKFLLKEVANGEYVLLAEVYLNDQPAPIVLQRHITLWKSGPKI